jgi:hypothetical protein
MVTSPEQTGDLGLRPGQNYLFKMADGWQQQQIWSELIASKLGKLLGLDVPNAYIGIDERKGVMGVLVEFFYRPGPTRFLHAIDVMKRIGVDATTGRPHSVRLNISACIALKIANPIEWWCRTLVFDALVGNTDRHLENWGFLTELNQDGRVWRLAPVFDNATSLGYQVVENRLAAATEPSELAKFVGKGTHHCGWDRADDRRFGHVELCRRMIEAYPALRGLTLDMLTFRMEDVDSLLAECVCENALVPFTPARAHFVSELIRCRKNGLIAAVGG